DEDILEVALKRRVVVHVIDLERPQLLAGGAVGGGDVAAVLTEASRLAPGYRGEFEVADRDRRNLGRPGALGPGRIVNSAGLVSDGRGTRRGDSPGADKNSGEKHSPTRAHRPAQRAFTVRATGSTT